RRAPPQQRVEHGNGRPGDRLDLRVGGDDVDRLLVELPRAGGVAAEEVAVGDAEVGAGRLVLAEELVLAGQRRGPGLHRAEGAQRGAEVTLAEQVLHPGQRHFGAVVPRDLLQRGGVRVDQRLAHVRGEAGGAQGGGRYEVVLLPAPALFRRRHFNTSHAGLRLRRAPSRGIRGKDVPGAW